MGAWTSAGRSDFELSLLDLTSIHAASIRTGGVGLRAVATLRGDAQLAVAAGLGCAFFK